MENKHENKSKRVHYSSKEYFKEIRMEEEMKDKKRAKEIEDQLKKLKRYHGYPSSD